MPTKNPFTEDALFVVVSNADSKERYVQQSFSRLSHCMKFIHSLPRSMRKVMKIERVEKASK